MAGSPNKAARRAARLATEAAQLATQAAATAAGAHVPPANVEPLTAPYAQARTPARPQERTTTRSAPSTLPHTHEGTAARVAFEQREASDYTALTEQLAPGMTVRILRTRPSWAAGWIEDLELDSGDVSELFEHLRAEHGGQVYSVQLIGRDNRILFKARVPIAGPVRRDGKKITRDQWDGTEAADSGSSQHRQQQPAAAPGFEPMTMLRMFLDMQKESSGQITEAIREMQRLQTKQTENLISSVMSQRADDRQSHSLAGQLAEVAKVTAQVDEIRAQIVASAPQSQQTPEAVDPIRQATVDIFKSAIQNEMGKRNAPPTQTAAQQRPQQQRAPRPPQKPTNGAAHRNAPNVEPLQTKQGAPPLQ